MHPNKPTTNMKLKNNGKHAAICVPPNPFEPMKTICSRPRLCLKIFNEVLVFFSEEKNIPPENATRKSKLERRTNKIHTL